MLLRAGSRAFASVIGHVRNRGETFDAMAAAALIASMQFFSSGAITDVFASADAWKPIGSLQRRRHGDREQINVY